MLRGVTVRDGVNPDALGVNGDAELPRSPVARVLPAMADGVNKCTKLGADVGGVDTDVQHLPPVDARP